jgi:xanthine dehydrogenase YagR molybdenum-binding subunit
VIQIAIADPESPLHAASARDIAVRSGSLYRKSAPQKQDTYAAILTRHGGQAVEATMEEKPGKEIDAYSTHSFGAVFAEVAVDSDFYSVHVRRFTGVYDVGLLINKRAGINQLSGGAVWGISMALFEETELDPRYGRIINADLSEYHLPTNADIGEMDISVLDVPDMKFNPLGARGVGEMGITGAAAAVGNAVYHATGKRVRDMPIKADKLLTAAMT